MNNDRISVQDAADQLGMTVQTVRVLMQKKKLPIGQVIDLGGKRSYLIWQSLVNQFKATTK